MPIRTDFQSNPTEETLLIEHDRLLADTEFVGALSKSKEWRRIAYDLTDEYTDAKLAMTERVGEKSLDILIKMCNDRHKDVFINAIVTGTYSATTFRPPASEASSATSNSLPQSDHDDSEPEPAQIIPRYFEEHAADRLLRASEPMFKQIVQNTDDEEVDSPLPRRARDEKSALPWRRNRE